MEASFSGRVAAWERPDPFASCSARQVPGLRCHSAHRGVPTADSDCVRALGAAPPAAAAPTSTCAGRRPGPGRGGPRSSLAARASPLEVEYIRIGEVADVEEVEGVRVVLQDKLPLVQYLVKWKDGSPPTWEAKENLADNLVRDFEEKWWKACREGSEEDVRKLLGASGRALACAVDKERRSGLHFAAAVGNLPCTRLLVAAGANINNGDKDGYTPLHMAVGYSHTEVVASLLAAGADPELQDRQGRTVTTLVDSLRAQMASSQEAMARRVALEQVGSLLAGSLYEELAPERVLEVRANADGTRDFLCTWGDGAEDSWVSEGDVSTDVAADWAAGLESAEAEAVVRGVQQGDAREYLVRWADGHEATWESEDHVAPGLIAEYEAAMEQRMREAGQPLYSSSRGSGGGSSGGPSSNGTGPEVPSAKAERRRRARRRWKAKRRARREDEEDARREEGLQVEAGEAAREPVAA